MSDSYIVRRGSGGGTSGGLSVVGGLTPPKKPVDNLIWIKTETTKFKVVYMMNESPVSPEPNSLWIRPTAAGVPVYLDRKRYIKIGTASAFERVGNEWVERNGATYISNKWEPWIVYWYKSGDEATELTGGWLGINPGTLYNLYQYPYVAPEMLPDKIRMDLGEAKQSSVITRNAVYIKNPTICLTSNIVSSAHANMTRHCLILDEQNRLKERIEIAKTSGDGIVQELIDVSKYVGQKMRIDFAGKTLPNGRTMTWDILSIDNGISGVDNSVNLLTASYREGVNSI